MAGINLTDVTNSLEQGTLDKLKDKRSKLKSLSVLLTSDIDQLESDLKALGERRSLFNNFKSFMLTQIQSKDKEIDGLHAVIRNKTAIEILLKTELKRKQEYLLAAKSKKRISSFDGIDDNHPNFGTSTTSKCSIF